jgi:hypothetical protein
MAENIIVLKTNPGIKRDGTVFEGDWYVDGQWVRFQRGLPRKMGGARAIGKYLPEICTGLHTYTQNDYIYSHAGSASYLSRFTLDKDNNSSVITDRTPVGFVANSNNDWTFDVMYSSVDTQNTIIAQVSDDGDNIAKNTTGYIYTGGLTDTAPLTAVSIPAGQNASGGIVVLHPYTFYFGDAGVIGWSVPGDPTDLTGSGSGVARVTGQKVVKGFPLRAGAGSAPAGIFWSYDSVIRATFTGGSTVFQFDTISSDTSIISKNSVIEYDGVFYWAAVDRFLTFNGVVREVPNSMNLNWFFDNINPNYKEKVFALKVPRYGEIWWCFPFGDATECTHAVIYNVRENTWYDTLLPSEARSAASFSQMYAAPITTGTVDQGSGYNIWRQEIGTDAISGLDIEPLQSYFETCDLCLGVLSGKNSKLEISVIEPDFVQSGDMSVTIVGRANARAKEVESNTVVFPDDATLEPSKQVVMMKQQRRELRIRFESNVSGGNYQMGQVLLHIQPGDGTVLG